MGRWVVLQLLLLYRTEITQLMYLYLYYLYILTYSLYYTSNLWSGPAPVHKNDLISIKKQQETL